MLKEQASALGVAAAISFMGHRADVPDLLGGRRPLRPAVALRGLAAGRAGGYGAGLPVVATRVGGTDEVVIDGVTGRLVEPGDPDALADAIGEARAPIAPSALGLGGRARFLDAFTAPAWRTRRPGFSRSWAFRPGHNGGW